MWTSKRSDLRAAQSEKDREAVRVSMPVQVLAFYPDTMTVDVQPLVKEAIDGSYASAAPILGLHIACLCAGDYVIRPWYKRGDVGWVIVADFDSDAALQTGREAEPNTRRNHAPGGQPLPRRRLPPQAGHPRGCRGRPGTGRRKRVSGGFKNGDRHSRRRGYPR